MIVCGSLIATLGSKPISQPSSLQTRSISSVRAVHSINPPTNFFCQRRTFYQTSDKRLLCLERIFYFHDSLIIFCKYIYFHSVLLIINVAGAYICTCLLLGYFVWFSVAVVFSIFVSAGCCGLDCSNFSNGATITLSPCIFAPALMICISSNVFTFSSVKLVRS